MTTSTKVSHPWSSEALFAKAQRYAEEMLAQDRDDWKFAFWSSLTLELLARSALSNVSPTLLADQEWNNLYFALGHTPKAKKFVPSSVGISEVFSRLGAIILKFDTRLLGFSVLHLQHRNEELHSGSTPFENFNNSDWLPLFYESAEVLVNSIGYPLEALIGEHEAHLAAQLIAAAKDESAKAVAKSIAAHKTVWERRQRPEQEHLANQSALWASRQKGHRVKCPACNSDALVSGTPLAPPNQKLKDGFIVVTQSYLPSKFECIACGLKINGLPELHACGLGNDYKATSTYVPEAFYRPFDEHPGYEDDNNEP